MVRVGAMIGGHCKGHGRGGHGAVGGHGTGAMSVGDRCTGSHGTGPLYYVK